MGAGTKNDQSTTPVTHQWSIQTATAAAAELAPGTRLGQFRVEARIGRGGLGIVYRAYDDKLKRSVALKVLAGSSSSPASASHLLEEARAAAALTHPSIAAIHDVQQQEGVIFIVMELVAGTTLRAEMASAPIAPEIVVRRARDIAAGLARAHRSKIVHRDLKPENVMVTPDGDAKILDFGLAREAPESAPPSSETGATGIAGTPDYMAPEQARGRRADPRADVFSFGVVLYEMLTGKRPFTRSRRAAPDDAKGPVSDAWANIPPIATVAPGVPEGLARLVDRCLALDPAARFADGDELLDALRALDAAPPSPPSPASRSTGKLALWGGGAALGVAALLVAVGMTRARPPAVAGPTAPPAPTSLVPSITSAPVQITHEGLCSGTPTFADDGSIVFSREDADRSELYRLDPVTGDERAITSEGATSSRPAPGASGEIVYRYKTRGRERGTEIRSVSLAGGPPRTLSPGADPGVAAGSLFFLQTDSRAIRRRPLGEGPEEVVFDAAPSTRFLSLTVSRDGRWLAAGLGTLFWTFASPLCVAPLDPRGSLDCASAGVMTSRRATFSADGRGLYYARGKSLQRLDLATKTTAATPLPVMASNVAVAPDGGSLVYSTCRLVYEVFRRTGDVTVPVTGFTDEVGTLAVGPRGEVAFVVANDAQASLGITDGAGGPVRVLTGPDALVTEMAFSPDGSRLVFHDATADKGGLFVVDADGMSVPTRITSDAHDTIAAWVDADHVVYTHAESGFPSGRAYVVGAAGGEPQPLPKLPGIVIGAVPSRRVLLVVVGDSAGDRFAEATLDGHLRDLPLRGAPKGAHWDVSLATSPSGRYMGWFAAGEAWQADLRTSVASRVPLTPAAGRPIAIQPDDQGRLTVAFQHSEGQLYRASGRFP